MPCKEVDIKISPIRTVQVTISDQKNNKSRESIREVKMKNSPQLSNDNPFYKREAKNEITKGKYVEELYLAHYSFNTHPSMEELSKAKYISTDKQYIVNSKIRNLK